jgi:hypothetical protein
VHRAGVADHDLPLLNGVAALVGGRAGVHGVLVIDAPADGVYLDDLQTPGGGWARWRGGGGGWNGVRSRCNDDGG